AAVPPVVDLRQHLRGQGAGVGPGPEVLAGDVLEHGVVVGRGGQQLGGGGGAPVGGGDDGAVGHHGLAAVLLRGAGVAAEGEVSGRGGVPGAGVVAGGHQFILSMIRAMPWPPPTHSVARPKRPSRSRRPFRSVVVMRAPVEPQGWPSAIAPPWTLSVSWSR